MYVSVCVCGGGGGCVSDNGSTKKAQGELSTDSGRFRLLGTIAVFELLSRHMVSFHWTRNIRDIYIDKTSNLAKYSSVIVTYKIGGSTNIAS